MTAPWLVSNRFFILHFTGKYIQYVINHFLPYLHLYTCVCVRWETNRSSERLNCHNTRICVECCVVYNAVWFIVCWCWLLLLLQYICINNDCNALKIYFCFYGSFFSFFIFIFFINVLISTYILMLLFACC